MKKKRIRYADWSDIVKIFLSGALPFAGFTAKFLLSEQADERWMYCLLGTPFLMIALMSVVFGILKWINERGNDNGKDS